MPDIHDIEKLRPELLKKSLAELERQQTEIAMAIERKRHEEEVKAKEELAARANDHIDAVVSGLTFLHDNGVLPLKFVEAFSRNDGRFVPATFLRAVTAESLVPREMRPRRAASGPKRRRRVRDEHGNLVPRRASQAAE